MQKIQWFPGHMAKAVRLMEDNLKLVSGVLVILDARAPFACINPKLDKLFENKRILYVVNKSDLVEQKDVNRILDSFKRQSKQCIAVSFFDKKSMVKLKSTFLSMFDDIIKRNEEKGVFKPIRAMVVGIPNTGKSTVINALCSAKKAITGDKAGVTRSGQWVKTGTFELFDTPGTMPFSFENQEDAKHLAYIGCVNDDILDFGDLTFELIKELKDKYPELLKARYGLTDLDKETIEIFDDICLKRGFILKGKEPDYDRASVAIIDDLRKGRIGKIIFE